MTKPTPTSVGTSADELSAMAEILRSSGNYRIQRRLEPRRIVAPSDDTPTKLGLFIDVETTGLNPYDNEIIELAMIPFTYALDGRIFEIHDAFEQFNEPRKPIPAAITHLTGITDEMVADHKIDPAEVASFANSAALVIAHNAAFDRRFVEHLSDVFSTKPWACSMSQIDWMDEGYEGTKLVYLAAGAGFFYEGHRAAHDCRAAIELLAAPLLKSGVPAMQKLLENARRPSWRIWAENAPFDLKDILKARGYRWNGDDNPNPRAWFVDVEDHQREAELLFLSKEIYLRDIELLVHRITAYNRFSDRN
ncbi:MAG: DNA polymerase III subunit epsilon [Sphingopyxis sp.]|nr:MAG: DNA polymerase III subunit epsilon [Sphingopyxis sp.]